MTGLTVDHEGQSHEVPDTITVRIGTGFSEDDAKNEYLTSLTAMSTNPAALEGDGSATEGDGGEGSGEGDAGQQGAAGEGEGGAGAGEGDGSASAGADEGDGSAAADDIIAAEIFQKYGYDSEESMKSALEKGKTLDEREATLAKKEADLERYAAVIDELQNPFADDEDAQIASFKKGSGINDRTIVTEMVTRTRDELLADPVRAMALAKIAENPEMGKTFKLDALMGKIERAAKAAGVDFDNKESDEYKDFMMDGLDAVQKVEKYRAEFGTNKNSMQSLLASREQAQTALGEKTTSIRAEISKLGLKTVPHKFDGKEISLEAPKDVLQAIPEHVINHLAKSLDTSTPEGRNSLKTAVEDYLLISQVRDGHVAKAAYAKGVKDTQLAAEEKAAKVFRNGGPKTGDFSGKGGGKQGVVNPTDQEVAEAWGTAK